jgi:hypothetical protein
MTLSKIHIYEKMMKKKKWCTWTIISIYYNKLQKTNSKIHSYEKVLFGKKDIWSFSKIIMLACCISFVPTYQIKNVKNILMEQNDI